MAQPKILFLLGVGAIAYFLLSKKQVSPVPGMSTLPYEPSEPDDSTEPPTVPVDSEYLEPEPGEPAPAQPAAPWLGGDPFPANAIAITTQKRGSVWYSKNPATGRWQEFGLQFGASEGYRTIGMLARNHHVLEVQDETNNSLWKPFLWNAYGYPVSFPLQSFA